jgi:hypothetical protein
MMSANPVKKGWVFRHSWTKGYFRATQDNVNNYVKCKLVAHEDGTIPKSKKLKIRSLSLWGVSVLDAQAMQDLQDKIIKELEKEIQRRQDLVGILFPETKETEQEQKIEPEELFLPPASSSLFRGD